MIDMWSLMLLVSCKPERIPIQPKHVDLKRMFQRQTSWLVLDND